MLGTMERDLCSWATWPNRRRFKTVNAAVLMRCAIIYAVFTHMQLAVARAFLPPVALNPPHPPKRASHLDSKCAPCFTTWLRSVNISLIGDATVRWQFSICTATGFRPEGVRTNNN